MDYKLKGNDEVSPELKQQIETVDTLVIFLSPAWLESEWCQWELETFLKQQQYHTGRIFIVELEKISQDKPETLADKLGYRFWQESHDEKMQMLGFPLPNTDHDQEYFSRLLNLSIELADTLKAIRQTTDNPPIEQPKATVYVAPVNDSLLDERNDLISELRQYQIDVLPRSNQLNVKDFQKNMDDELKQCSHFIQLLDNNYAFGIPASQKLIAESHELPILQWLNSEQNHQTDNPEHQ